MTTIKQIEQAAQFIDQSNANGHGQWRHHPSWEPAFKKLVDAGRAVYFRPEMVTPDGTEINESVWCGRDDLSLGGYWTRDALVAELTRRSELELYHSAKRGVHPIHRGFAQRHGERLAACAAAL